ncbi:substrate-binding periplasmic protein [Roseateles saccharophilus]|uniref:ABC-type amino acid transport substrate-binding protein n=1 Tax=Roseateles saccharophilus TaxID=304 RepID=A0A4R3UHS8_ROSSA|nr:transporter substrate-binding domain-containing protein [Roseateles saccharophilus]MDG0834723.1 transporter substrate-binding domain-containing protein [Roseateles saccharophilus]TCU88983.1 ABC-type amino acid transport substrate-binding protein [Roseateles saccharophilus]
MQWHRLLTSCALGVALSCTAQDITLLRTVAQSGNLPKFNTGDTYRPGYCVEMLRAIEATEATVRFEGLDQALPLKRIEGLLESGRVDVFCGLALTPAREARISFLPHVVYVTRHRLAVRADDPLHIEKLEELRRLPPDEPIMVNRSSLYEQVLQDVGGIPLDASVSDPALSLRKLINHRGRAYYFSDMELNYYIKRERLQDKVRLLPQVFHEDRPLFAYRRDLPEATVERLRSALDRLQADGSLQRIAARYDAR